MRCASPEPKVGRWAIAALRPYAGRLRSAQGHLASRSSEDEYPLGVMRVSTELIAPTIVGASCVRLAGNDPKKEPEMAKSYPAPPEMAIDPARKYTATLDTTAGTMTAELFPKEAPNTVNNFVFLAREGFYDNVIFHRVIDGFMIQGGDPTGTGRGGPGYKFRDEPVNRPYSRGTLAMANAGPNTNGSQFFVMHADYKLPPSYTIFGRLTGGEDVLDKIATARTGAQDRPAEPVTINSVTIAEE